MARVDDNVISIHDKVANVDDKVVEVLNGAQITFIFDQAREISNLNRSDGKEAKHVIEQTANDVDQVKRSSSPNLISSNYDASPIILENQLRDNIHKWLSPSDPLTNHNIACDTDHKKTATWFFQGSIFREWKSTGSLLWIHGKRAPRPTSYPIPSDDVFNHSRLWQEYSLVGGCLPMSIIMANISCQFLNHRRYSNLVRGRRSVDGIFLFRLPERQQTRLA